MRLVHFVTHPEVVIDPSVPVPDWPLSSKGRRRMADALERPWMQGIGGLFTSAERKARDGAEMIAERFGVAPVAVDTLGENDRSATGYLEKQEFEATADRFFARPLESVRGWERAIDAQDRIVAALGRVLDEAPAKGDIVVVSHGGVGALLLCHLKGVPIDREQDQPGGGGGNVFTFDAASRAIVADWRPIESA